jgi:hypothetical protein
LNDFGYEINTLVTNLADILIFILPRLLIMLFKNIVYLDGILHGNHRNHRNLG